MNQIITRTRTWHRMFEELTTDPSAKTNFVESPPVKNLQLIFQKEKAFG